MSGIHYIAHDHDLDAVTPLPMSSHTVRYSWSGDLRCLAARCQQRLRIPAGASVDALRAEWWNQPATNQTDEPRTTGTDGGSAGPMLDPHSVLDNLWGGRKGKLTEVGSGEYDVPQACQCNVAERTLNARLSGGIT